MLLKWGYSTRIADISGLCRITPVYINKRRLRYVAELSCMDKKPKKVYDMRACLCGVGNKDPSHAVWRPDTRSGYDKKKKRKGGVIGSLRILPAGVHWNAWLHVCFRGIVWELPGANRLPIQDNFVARYPQVLACTCDRAFGVQNVN